MQKKFGGEPLWLALLCIVGFLPSYGQNILTSDGGLHTLSYKSSNKVQEFKLSTDIQVGHICFDAYGADGGIKKNTSFASKIRAKGGQGALISACFEIGIGAKKIPPGATILFIPGQRGQNKNGAFPYGAGGGGGTAVFFQESNNHWTLLMVAGGGMGGAADCCAVQDDGTPGEVFGCVIYPDANYTTNEYCYLPNVLSGSQCGGGGGAIHDNTDAIGTCSSSSNCDYYPCGECGPGKMGWPGANSIPTNAVKPTGGYGGGYLKDGTPCGSDNRPKGGFGFGGGGQGDESVTYGRGEGGGFTSYAYKAGGSYLNNNMIMLTQASQRVKRGVTSDPKDGKVGYKIIPAPKAVCSDLEVSLPSTGTQAFAYFVMAYGSATTILGENLLVAEVQSQELLTTLDCADIGTQAITLEVTGTVSGYSTQCTANLTVKDEAAPVINCKAISISTDANGHASFSTASLLDSYTDNCSTSPASLTADKNSFTYDCNFDGQTLTESVKVTATDDYGNSKNCMATVTIAITSMDGAPPIASCKDIAVQLGSQGQLTITPDAIDQGSFDPCGGSIINYQFGKSHMELQVESEGFNADLSWTITSLDGNTIFAERPSYPHDAPSPGLNASETSFLEDIILAPGCYLFNWKDSYGDGFWCYGDTNFYRLTDNDGNVLAYGECADIGAGQSTQFCIEPDSFVDELVLDCDDIGYYSASLFLTDLNGNTSSCESVVTVKGGPQAICKSVTVQLSPEGAASLLAVDLDAGSSSNCGNITNYQIGQSDLQLQVESEGFNADLSWTITSLDGNTVYAERPSYPHDAPSPGIGASETSFLEDITLAPGCYLFNWKDSYGDGFWCYAETHFYQLTNSDGETLAYGECAEIGFGQSTEFCIEPDTFVDELTFDCEDIGARLATLFVTDATGRSSSCQTTIEVEAPPMQDVQCSPDLIQIELDEDGLANLSVEQVLHSDDLPCYENQYSLSKTEFDCQDVGFGQVTLTAQHPDGSTRTCETTVRVQDNILPTPLCQDITASLGPDGQVTIDASLADNGSTDHCGIFDLYFDDYRLTRTFDCEDVGVEELYTIMVEDYNGNLAYCAVTLTIKDETPPIVNCKNITIQLDENGIALIPEDAINDQSSDACGPLSFDTDITSFNCEDIGDHTLTLTIQDVHGNSNSCEANVKVVDPIAPSAYCKDITVDLNLDGIAIINPISLDAGSTDNCGIETFEVSTSYLDRTNIGVNSIELSVIDASGNTNNCTALVTVNPALIAYSWDDQDGDGKQDAGEPPLSDVSVAIIDHSSGLPIQQGVTNAEGAAVFNLPTILPNQKVKLLFTEKPNHRFTLKDKGNDDLIDSDVSRSNGYTKAFTLDSDGLTEQYDAGLWSPGEIQAFVWDDLDGDGQQDEDEPALADAQVELLENDNSTIVMTTTDENGIATIFDVPADRSVKLRFTALDGYSLTKKDKGNDNIDSDAKPSSGLTTSFSVDKGQQLFTEWDAGMINSNQNALTTNPAIHAPAFYKVEDNELKLKVITNHLRVYPNPFSNRMTIEFSLSELEKVVLTVFNQHGQIVNQLIDSELDPGKHQRLWDGSDFGGTKLPAGVYFLRLQVGEKWITEKVSLVRD